MSSVTKHVSVVSIAVAAAIIVSRPAPIPQAAAEPGGGAAACSSVNGDVNGDGALDITDAIYTLSFLFTGGPEPVPLCTPKCVAVLPGEMTAVASCMPPVPSDPLSVTWDATVVNFSSGKIEIRIVSAKLTAGPRTGRVTIGLLPDPQSVEVLPGEPSTIAFRKVGSDRSADCEICDSGATLQVEYLVDGVLQDAPLRYSGTVECTF